MSKLEELKRDMKVREVEMLKNLEAQKLNSKLPAVNAFQQKQITAEEYESLTGEAYAKTVQAIYEQELERIRESMMYRVKGGHLTPEQYREITGVDYPEEVA